MKNEIQEMLLKLNNEYIAKQYVKGQLNDSDIRALASYASIHADKLRLYGKTINDYKFERQICQGNPAVKKFYTNAINDWYERQEKANSQNALNNERLQSLEQEACQGMGLHTMIRKMKKFCKSRKDVQARIAYMLVSLEYANLKAKTQHYAGQVKRAIYERKNYIIRNLVPLLEEAKYRFGLSFEPGKNAAYVFYCYLPNGSQLSWHTNDWNLYQIVPPIDVEWDGQPATTMLKIVNYINSKFNLINK